MFNMYEIHVNSQATLPFITILITLFLLLSTLKWYITFEKT